MLVTLPERAGRAPLMEIGEPRWVAPAARFVKTLLLLYLTPVMLIVLAILVIGAAGSRLAREAATLRDVFSIEKFS